MDEDDETPAPIEVPYSQLAPETLERLLAEVALRDDTDYGDRPRDLPTRVELARRALERGELVIMYDFATASAAVVPAAQRPRS